MSQSAFEALRSSRPEQRSVVLALERELAETLGGDRRAVIDDRILVQQLPVDIGIIKELLIELVRLKGLRTLFLWNCPNGRGTAEEAERVADFPQWIECERCGEVHVFNSAQIEVRFQSTRRLLRDLMLGG